MEKNEQKSFEDTKRIVNCNTSLSYTDFNENFDIHTDASNFQLGEVIIQYVKPIYLYRRDITAPITWYKVIEKYLFIIVKILK